MCQKISALDDINQHQTFSVGKASEVFRRKVTIISIKPSGAGISTNKKMLEAKRDMHLGLQLGVYLGGDIAKLRNSFTRENILDPLKLSIFSGFDSFVFL